LSPGIVEGIARRSQAGHPISMIPNGCDLDLFQPALRRAPPIPGVAPGDVVAVFTGAHGLANGLRAVLDAAAVLQKRGRGKIKFVFIGDGKQKPMLEKRARDEALDNCVFLKPIRKRDLTMLLAASDIGLMILSNVPAFYFGTSPNKFFDYLAAGLPVLCNYPGWLADMIAEHQCGLAVPPDDPEAFADAMERLADSAKSQMAMGKNARALGESRFSRERISADFIQTLEAAFTSYAANWSDRSRFDLPLIK
jgi:glycosyltransferase involved in cell wall biosynthesis